MSASSFHPGSPSSHGSPVDMAGLYAPVDDGNRGLLVGAAVALVLHAAMFTPVFVRALSRGGAGIERSTAPARTDTVSSTPPQAKVSPAPVATPDKINAPEGELASNAKTPLTPMTALPSRIPAPLTRRTPAPPPAPTTAPAGMDKGSAITMAWISAEAFEAMVAEKGRVEQAGFQRTAQPVPNAPMRTDPIPLASKNETNGGEVAMVGSAGKSAPDPSKPSVARPEAAPTAETKGPPPAPGIGGDRVVQLEGEANNAAMKTSTPQGMTWEEPKVKTGPLVMGEVLPGQGKAADKESSAPVVGMQRGNVTAAPQPNLKAPDDPTIDGKGQLSPGKSEAQPAIKEVAVSAAQPSVAPPTVVGKPVVPLKTGAGDTVPLGDASTAVDVVSNQHAQQIGDKAQRATRQTLPQVGQEAREAKPEPTGAANDPKNPPRPGIAEDVVAQGARSAPSVTLADKVMASGGKDDRTAGDGQIAMVVPNPRIDDAAPARTAPGRPGIGSENAQKAADKTPDPSATAAAQRAEDKAAPAAESGRPQSAAQGAPGGGEKPRVTSLPKSDRESPPVSISPEPIRLRPGAVLVGEGIEIKTVMPRLSIIAQVSSLPANPEVRVVFSRSGKVVEAEVIRSTGYPNWDGPILSSLYLWTVRGERFERINGPVEFKFVILITD